MYTNFDLKRENYTLTGYKWAAEAPKGILVYLHGLGATAADFDAAAARMTAAGFAVFGVDRPGQGRSPGKRGHVGCSFEIVKIVDEMIIYAKTEYPDIPVFVMGHSMGGNIALSYRYYRRDVEVVSGYIAHAPWLMLDTPWLGKHYKSAVFASMFLPKLVINKKTNPISLQTAADRERDARLVTAKADEGKPVYLFNGTADTVCMPAGAHAFHAKAGKHCKYKEWDGLGHDLLATDRAEEVLESVIAWMTKLI